MLRDRIVLLYHGILFYRIRGRLRHGRIHEFILYLFTLNLLKLLRFIILYTRIFIGLIFLRVSLWWLLRNTALTIKTLFISSYAVLLLSILSFNLISSSTGHFYGRIVVVRKIQLQLWYFNQQMDFLVKP